jgi:type IV pilus assembly protein PilM
MSILSGWLATPPPEAAIEISPEAVSVAVLGWRGGSPVVQGYAVAPLRHGAVVPSLTGHNVVDRPAVVEALRAACDRASTRPRRAALVIPDLSARVSIVRFDQLPPKGEDLEQLIRWQIKKSSPFPIDDARVAFGPGQRTEQGHEFIVIVARREIVAEYEGVCLEAGVHAGLVDVATLSVVNLVLGRATPPAGDWLLVHMRPDYTSLAIMRGAHLVFFRNRTEGEEEPLADVVHQTTMYYQDRLEGRGFSHVFLCGTSREADTVERARLDLEAHLGVGVEPVEADLADALAERVAAAPEVSASVPPLLGILVRASRDPVYA